jgi:uncharacterized protein
VIGPWDHAGTRTPKLEFCGLKVGPESLLDVAQLHVDWYAWTLLDGPRPAFLQKRVAYYVMGAEKWRYADTLRAVTSRRQVLYLDSIINPVDVFGSGWLRADRVGHGGPDSFVYDPRDVSLAGIECTVDPESRTDQRMLHACVGRHLIYLTEPFAQDTEVSGFFGLSLWLSIDQPDTDFQVAVYEVGLDGSAIQLTNDSLRARYRESLRTEKLVRTPAPLRYDFERFMFVARRISAGSRLRLVIGPINSIYSQKNYNSGGEVARESMSDARTVTVNLYHDDAHPSALYMPIGRPESS